MPQKRKIHPPGSQIAQSKRTRYSNGDNGTTSEDATSKAQVDPTYGQRSAFPGLDDHVEEDVLFYGPASDGLEYLRMVRSEAKGVPNLLTATKPDEENDLYQDYPQAYYSDGAYVAASLPSAFGNDTQLGADGDVDPQEAYYTSLLTRFHALSSFFRSPNPVPPSAATTATAMTLATAPTKKWRTMLLYTTPTTSLLAQLSQESIINGIVALEKHLDWRMLERGPYVGAWAWGLLARCRSAGMMGSEEVGVLRDLGKKARGLVRGLRAGLGGVSAEAEAEAEEEEEEEKNDGAENGQAMEVEIENMGGGDEVDRTILDETARDGNDAGPTTTIEHNLGDPDRPDPNEVDMAAAKQRLLAKLLLLQQTDPAAPLSASSSSSSSSPPQLPTIPQENTKSPTTVPAPPIATANDDDDDNNNNNNGIPLTTRITATLDMIITIVGEEYGQRDLLCGRGVWD
ncbi:MAG: hypothetical protein Q9185_004515 [Variospora sp. 1 TL-2023]